MPNRKIKHITATLTGASSSETFDVCDEEAVREFGSRKFFFVGDSYLQGYTPGSSDSKGWVYWVNQYLGLTDGVDSFKLSSDYISGVTTGGWGMAPTVTNVHVAWSDLVDDIDTTLVPCDDITDVVIIGGTNDTAYVSEIPTGMDALNTSIHNKFPNVKRISLGMLAWNGSIVNFRDSIRPVYDAYSNCVELGWDFWPNTVWAAHKKSYVSSDNVHLTQDGYKNGGKYIAECVKHGDCDVEYHETFLLVGTGHHSGITTDDSSQIVEFNFKNGLHAIRFRGTIIENANNAITINLGTAITTTYGYYTCSSIPDFVMTLADTSAAGNVGLCSFEYYSGQSDIVKQVGLILRDRSIQCQMRTTAKITQTLKVVCYNPPTICVSGWDM